MKSTIGLAQCCHPKDGNVISMVESWVKRAKDKQVNLLVFPESLMTRYEAQKGEFLAAAQPLDGSFATSIDALAKENDIWIVYTLNELNELGNPFNTVVLVDNQGEKKLVYRKVHLFDTDFTKESDRMAYGSELVKPVDTPFGTVGLSICYDLRFPEMARTLALQGTDILINPAAWVSGDLKVDQWETLLKARAIENEMFVIGLSRVDDGYIGQSRIVGPDGVVIAKGGSSEELIVAEIDTEAISDVRNRMPVFNHRKPELYGELTLRFK